MKNKIIYSLTIEDIQNVAQQEIERELNLQEIEVIKESIAKKMNWYDAIAYSIYEQIKVEF
jgi:hypothetical protein